MRTAAAFMHRLNSGLCLRIVSGVYEPLELSAAPDGSGAFPPLLELSLVPGPATRSFCGF